MKLTERPWGSGDTELHPDTMLPTTAVIDM